MDWIGSSHVCPTLNIGYRSLKRDIVTGDDGWRLRDMRRFSVAPLPPRSDRWRPGPLLRRARTHS